MKELLPNKISVNHIKHFFLLYKNKVQTKNKPKEAKKEGEEKKEGLARKINLS